MKLHLPLAIVVVLPMVLSAAEGSPLSDGEKEKFLLAARVVSAAEVGKGVTRPVKAELTDGKLKHSASVQRVNKELSDFFGEDGTRVPMVDAWRFNVAAYKIDRLLGLNIVAVTVSRPYQGRPGAFTWWVDNVLMEEADRLKNEVKPPDEEAYKRQMETVKVFDELIINIDRNYGNIIITKDWKIALIDHTRSMTAYSNIRNKENLTRCTKRMLEAMKNLKQADVEAAVGTFMKPAEIKALMARRDKIVEFFEAKAKQKGAGEVILP